MFNSGLNDFVKDELYVFRLCIGGDIAVFFSTRENTYKKAIYEKGFKLMVSGLVKNADSPVIAHKTGNYLENYMEGQRTLKNGFDDVIF